MGVYDVAYNNTDEEYQEICGFLDALSTQDPFMHWESGRMNFWRYNVHANKDPHDQFFRDNVHLWRSGGRLVGLAISEYGRNDMFIELCPEYRVLFPEILRC